ncbi:hypothetical protein [Pendulispora albinea]|uniref:Uncharacterized protein n=1 Tax=Pendulispora albinea TaxID=2741071 RepID=A0ABZ2LYA8_9BACT
MTVRAKAASPRRTVDRDGVVEIELPRKGGALLWLALLFAIAVAGLVLYVRGRAPSAPLPARPMAEKESPEEPPRQMPSLPGPTAMNDEPSPPEAPAPAAEEPLAAPAASASSLPEGIRAFPRPGTKRIKVGIVVPEDFELPPGYVRHYQSTDKGEGLRPILMFHPDYAPKDDQGHPLPIPADRIVPPEMAPPGLALERLEVPLDPYADPER